MLCTLHTVAIWHSLGGWAGIASPWPLARHDHPLYFHSALVTRAFLKQSGTTAGYDPSFMAGYVKSVVWPSSSTLPELAVAGFGGSQPERAYKAYVLVAAALVPWLVWLTCATWRLPPAAAAFAVLGFLLYVWTDFPISYVAFGMLPYFLSVPLALWATALLARYLVQGGAGLWLAAAAASSLAWLVHLTAAMLVAPAALLTYASAIIEARRAGARMPRGRHLGFWLMPVVVLALNAFWWWPGLWLASTVGPGIRAFVHSNERVDLRLAQIFSARTPVVESLLWGLAFLGLPALVRRDRVAAVALGAFAAAGFGWGYLAGAAPALDLLQPGRHTFALYTGLALAGGLALAEVCRQLRAVGGRLDLWACAGLALLGVRLFGAQLDAAIRSYVLAPEPFLSSKPSPRLLWVLEQVKKTMKPGQRLLYEEGGQFPRGLPDPFRDGRYSGLLPYRTGVEVIGGPYLHASLKTNFTQFGEGKLFGQERWDRAHFERYARLYRPSAILCWSSWARAFCRAHPELIEVLATLDLRAEGELLFGRVIGFEGAAIKGAAQVQAEPGKLHVSAPAAELDGTVVLRYHSAAYLRSRPPVALEAVRLEDDPTPFIGLRPASGRFTLKLALPP